MTVVRHDFFEGLNGWLSPPAYAIARNYLGVFEVPAFLDSSFILSIVIVVMTAEAMLCVHASNIYLRSVGVK